MVSLSILALLALACIAVPLLSRYGVDQIDLAQRWRGPGHGHWLGTDALGRDTFTRLFYAGRISLSVGVTVALSAGLIGTAVGAVAGYYGGFADNVLMRITDLFLAIPYLVLLLIVSSLFEAGIPGIMVILTLFYWMPTARIVRGVVLSLKEKEFVEAARVSGASRHRIVVSHVLPNAFGPIVVSVTLLIAAAILTESALSFLGFGVLPPTPTWGNMLSNSRLAMFNSPWLPSLPGAAIVLTVLCVNLLGDGLRDALDPRGRSR
jgi:peptide/nickel transport system permease protein